MRNLFFLIAFILAGCGREESVAAPAKPKPHTKTCNSQMDILFGDIDPNLPECPTWLH